MDASAIDKLLSTGATMATNDLIPENLLLVPNGFALQDIEKYQSVPNRFRRTFTTRRIDDFLAYVKGHASKDATAVFIAPDMDGVTAILNHGTSSEPEWGDDTAKLELRHEPEFAAFLGMTKRQHTQRELVTYLEDWLTTTFVSAVDASGDIMQPRTAVSAARRVTIKASAESNHEHGDMNASRSTLEQVEAKGTADQLPDTLSFFGPVYFDTEPRNVYARLGMVLNDKAPIFTLRIINWEQHVAQLALEVEQRVREALGADMQVYVGSSKGNY